jgi:hypothetical protein
MISLIIQTGITISIKAIIKPSGFVLNASRKFPFEIYKSALVDPHDGQGIPVIFLNKQTLMLELRDEKCL